MPKKFITDTASHLIGYKARQINDKNRDKKLKAAKDESFILTGKILKSYKEQGKRVNGSKIYHSIYDPKEKKINREHELRDDFFKKF
ncbi:MAG: hypothetical protein ACI4M5_02870 [Christensenellales bacterium]